MPTSTESTVAYVPRFIVPPQQNEIHEPVSVVKDITVDVEQLIDASPKPGLSGSTKLLIGVAVVIGIAILTAVAIALAVTLSNEQTTTSTTTTSTTATTSTSTTSTTTTAMPAPGNLVGYRGNNGQNYSFVLTGAISGTIWGTTIYTDDSNLVTAAVHSGFVQVGQTSTITVMILAGQSSYTSTTQNGITSNGYGSWSGSYMIISAVVTG